MKHYSQLTQEQRYHIYGLLQSGNLQKDIAHALGVDKSTISRELSRNRSGTRYQPTKADKLASIRRCTAKKHIKVTEALKKLISEKIKDDWSPDQISGHFKTQKLTQISHERIYQYLAEDKKSGGILYTHLRHSGKKYKKRYGAPDRRGQMKNRVSIDLRPKVVEKKQRIGDWEGDTIIGMQQQKAIVTLVDRASRFTLMGRVATKHADIVSDIIVELLLPVKKYSHTLTLDNGKEFSGHEFIAKKLTMDVYFADPYSSWQRGANENTNGLIRQYIPKGSSFDNITDSQILEITNKINNRPRKALGYRTPNEVFNEAIMRPG